MSAPFDTLLVITPISGSGFSLPPFSSRDVVQTLQPITGVSGSGGNVLGSWIRRDINGNLINLVPRQLRKYESEISCKDVRSPALDDAWLGAILQVDCIPELSYLAGGTPLRPVVPGSERTVGHFVFYRPRLIMMVVDINNGMNEWQHEYNWKMGLQET